MLLLLLAWLTLASAQPTLDLLPLPTLEDVDEGEEDEEDEEVEEIPEPLRLIYTGASDGFGTGRYQFELLNTLRRILGDDGDLIAVTPHHGVMVRGDWLLIADDQRLGPLIALLQGGEVRCGEPQDTARLLRGRLGRMLVRRAIGNELADRIEDRSEPFEIRRCRSEEGPEAWLAGPAGRPVLADWTRFEIRLSITATATLDDRTQTAIVVGLPEREATRRATLLTDLRARYPEALYVDAGSFLDGTSRSVESTLSLLRPAAIELLERLNPTALTPGRTELVGGARHLLREAPGLPWVATNWRAKDPALALPASLLADVGPHRVAFLGVVDPELTLRSPLLSREGVTLIDPVEAVREEVLELRTSERPPDLVVLLTTARGALLTRLQQELTGVDLVLGDPGPETERLEELTAILRPAAYEDPPGLTLPLPEVGMAEVHFDGSQPARIVATPRQVTADLPSDAEILYRINQVRFGQFPRLDRPLLPAPPGDPLRPMPQRTWEKVACEAVLEHTGADIALLPSLPEQRGVPGPLTELLVMDRLAMLDVLEVHHVQGGGVRHLMERARAIVPVICGVPSTGSLQVDGRSIETDRRYDIVTTDRLRTDTRIDGLIAEARSSRLLDRPTFQTVTDPAGGPVTLRRAVVETLRQQREDPDDLNPLATLLARKPSDRTPQWVLRARPVSFSLERFQGAENDAFEDIPFTLATADSVMTVRTHNDIQAEYSSQGVVWDARARATWTRLRTEEISEPEDDLRLSSSVELPGLAIPLPPVSPRPFAELLYDSEFTPDEVDGEQRPWQRDLYLTAGLSSTFGIVQTLRVGAFALRDLSRTERPIELGARAELNTRVGFGPGLHWTNQLDAFYYADSRVQDTSDLRFRTLLDSRVGLPLAWWLSAAPYGRLFLFSGRVPQTEMLGTSWTLGLSLNVSGAFAL